MRSGGACPTARWRSSTGPWSPSIRRPGRVLPRTRAAPTPRGNPSSVPSSVERRNYLACEVRVGSAQRAPRVDFPLPNHRSNLRHDGLIKLRAFVSIFALLASDESDSDIGGDLGRELGSAGLGRDACWMEVVTSRSSRRRIRIG